MASVSRTSVHVVVHLSASIIKCVCVGGGLCFAPSQQHEGKAAAQAGQKAGNDKQAGENAGENAGKVRRWEARRVAPLNFTVIATET